LVKAGGSNSAGVSVVTFGSTQLGLHVIAIDGQGVGWTDTKDINVTVTRALERFLRVPVAGTGSIGVDAQAGNSLEILIVPRY